MNYYESHMDKLTARWKMKKLDLEINDSPSGPGYSDYTGERAKTLEQLWQAKVDEQNRMYQEAFAGVTEFKGKLCKLSFFVRR